MTSSTYSRHNSVNYVSSRNGTGRISTRRLNTVVATLLVTMTSTSALAGWFNDYELVETKNLTLDAANLEQFKIDAGAGSLVLVGEQGDEISVTAQVYQRTAKNDYCLSLDYTKGEAQALLAANNCNSDTRIDVTVTLPANLATMIQDTSGSINTNNTSVISIADGSGRIEINNNHTGLKIEDGSGPIDITQVAGDIEIDDGSGSIHVTNAQGEVTVRDGSGSINVNNARRFNLISDGSGSVNLSNVDS
ncbi:hypothetical protein DXX93_06360 [Thalassotalea euphylliae]|uniref:Adhesin domain-containing protein n=1 Tax=Thalassotalea euphylliae TaxID=1655234 RepID=A0A3E0TQB9_9GAMM|nr:hypothetical protein [Thalassotalea euphylliae]REL26242.1 hypothetical protein DXX93_06360 [Thalassotalea euphylliae]